MKRSLPIFLPWVPFLALCDKCVGAEPVVVFDAGTTAKVYEEGPYAGKGVIRERRIQLKNRQIAYGVLYRAVPGDKEYTLSLFKPCPQANWSQPRFLTARVGAIDVDKCPAEVSVERRGEREGRIVVRRQTEAGTFELRLSLLAGRRELFISGSLESKSVELPLTVLLRCYPSVIGGSNRDRIVTTGERFVEEREDQFSLKKDSEWWLLFSDRFYDEAKRAEESHGPCALVYLPEEMADARVLNNNYGVYTSLLYPKGTVGFHLALLEFPDTPNGDALAYLTLNAGKVREALTEIGSSRSAQERQK